MWQFWKVDLFLTSQSILKTQHAWELWRNDQWCLCECEWLYGALIRIILKMQIIRFWYVGTKKKKKTLTIPAFLQYNTKYQVKLVPADRRLLSNVLWRVSKFLFTTCLQQHWAFLPITDMFLEQMNTMAFHMHLSWSESSQYASLFNASSARLQIVSLQPTKFKQSK